MIDSEYMKSIGLNEDQVTLLSDALYRESRYRQILLQEGVNPKAVEPILRATKLETVDLTNEPLIRMKVKSEWSDFIN